MGTAALAEPEVEQSTLLDLDSKEINAYWVDPAQPLVVPKNPLHWKAHELQILLQILRKQAQKNPAQFNSKNYIDTLNAYIGCVQAINTGAVTDEQILEPGKMASSRDGTTAMPMGSGNPVGLDTPISTDNPITG